MTIIRIERQAHDFTITANATLRDERLSWQATGMLAYLLSLPDNWDPRGVDLWSRKTNGREATYAIMRELVALGYIERTRERDDLGHIRTVTTVRESPGQTDSQEPGPSSQVSGGVGDIRRTKEEEPTEEETTEELVLAPKSARKRDPIFEILFTLDSGNPYSEESRAQFTKTALGAVNQAAGQIRATGCSAEELMDAIAAWPDVMGGALCTASAVAKHLPRLRAAATGVIARGPDESPRERAELESVKRALAADR